MNNSKKDLLLGVMTGVAIVSLAGFVIMTVAYFQKSRAINNAASDNIKNDNSKSAPVGTISGADLKVNDKDNIRGNKKAPITIIEYSDFQCPYCARFHKTMLQVMADYKDKVRWVFRSLPLESIHTYAKKAALAAECAGEQGKFWEYADALYANQPKFSADYFGQLAGDMKLDTKKFNSCLSSGKYLKKIETEMAEAKSLGLTGTPASFINGVAVKGAYPYEQLKPTIDAALK